MKHLWIRQVLTPQMWEVILGENLGVSDEVKSILSKWSTWYTIESLLELLEKWEISPYDNSITMVSLWIINIWKQLESNSGNNEEYREMKNLIKLNNLLSANFWRFQQSEAENLEGIPQIQLNTRWRVNEILWSPDWFQV